MVCGNAARAVRAAASAALAEPEMSAQLPADGWRRPRTVLPGSPVLETENGSVRAPWMRTSMRTVRGARSFTTNVPKTIEIGRERAAKPLDGVWRESWPRACSPRSTRCARHALGRQHAQLTVAGELGRQHLRHRARQPLVRRAVPTDCGTEGRLPTDARRSVLATRPGRWR